MRRKSFISRHVVLTTVASIHKPVYAIILVQDECISEVVLLSEDTPESLVMTQFAEWNPLNFSEFYICPGLIDLSVRLECEDRISLSRAAIAGGVTFYLEEAGIYMPYSDETEPVCCDIGKVSRNVGEHGCIAYKIYLYPPSAQVEAASHCLEEVFRRTNDKLLIVDPNLPGSRALCDASPFRHEGIEARKSRFPTLAMSGAAFPELIANSSDSDRDEEELPQRTVTAIEQDLTGLPPFASTEETRSISVENALHFDFGVTSEQKPRKPRKRFKTIYEDLNERVSKFSLTIEALSLSEKEAYEGSGVTEFRRSESQKRISTPVAPESPLNIRKRLLGLSPLMTSPSPVDSNKYINHLANYTETWETVGLSKVFESLKRIQCRVHLCNLSSAQAINKVRQEKHRVRTLSCEVSAVNLFFNSEQIRAGDTRFKNLCPVRTPANLQLLWDLLKLKGIDCISSQHASLTPDLKAVDTQSFKKAMNGVACMGVTLQAVWTQLYGHLSNSNLLGHFFVRMSKWMSLHPAQVLGQALFRGSIERGKFADLVIWNPFEKVVVEDLAHSEMSPFHDLMLHGKIYKVYLRGNLAYDEGVHYNFGKFVVS